MKKLSPYLPFLVIPVSLIFVCLIIFFLKTVPQQVEPKNIFEEMYYKTESTYTSNNIFRKLKNVKIINVNLFDKELKETGQYNPKISYDSALLPINYTDLEVNFNFHQGIHGIIFFFKREIEDKLKIEYIIHYNMNNSKITKEIKVLINNKYIENKPDVKSYLQRYQITSKDLDNYYNGIVNQLVLKDWCSIYNSQYSPNNYGDVKVVTEWEKW